MRQTNQTSVSISEMMWLTNSQAATTAFPNRLRFPHASKQLSSIIARWKWHEGGLRIEWRIELDRQLAPENN